MSNVKNTVDQILAYLASVNGTSSYSSQSVANTATNPNIASFSTVLEQLNRNIDNASIKTNMNLYDYTCSNNTASTIVTPDINAIIDEIQADDSSTVDIDGLIEQYLLKNYGGSVSGVIKNLSGVETLPTQAITLQDQIFHNIVTKISIQVREKLYNSNTSSSESIFYSDDSVSDSSDSDTSIY